MDYSRNTIGTLIGFSFVSSQEDNDIFEMHPLVQLSTRKWDIAMREMSRSLGLESYDGQHYTLGAWRIRKRFIDLIPNRDFALSIRSTDITFRKNIYYISTVIIISKKYYLLNSYLNSMSDSSTNGNSNRPNYLNVHFQ
jgi:hypothetical protein